MAFQDLDYLSSSLLYEFISLVTILGKGGEAILKRVQVVCVSG